jgi:hypothetical protein
MKRTTKRGKGTPRATGGGLEASGAKGVLPVRRSWREQLRDVRTTMSKAERQRGREREATLVRACRAFVLVTIDAEPRETRAFDRAAWAVEMKLGRMVNDCIGCFATRSLPEDPPADRRRVHRSVKPTRRVQKARVTS